MDMLASYDDEGDSQTPDNRPPDDRLTESFEAGTPKSVKPPEAANLESEWETFQKMLGDSAFSTDNPEDLIGQAVSVAANPAAENEQEKLLVPERQCQEKPSRSRSRSRSKSRSRSNSSNSSSSSSRSSSDSDEEKKKGQQTKSLPNSSSSDEDDEADKTSGMPALTEKEPVKPKQDTSSPSRLSRSRSPPILRKARSLTPIETRVHKSKSKSRSKSKSMERKKSRTASERSRKSRSRSHDRHRRSSRRKRRSRSRSKEKSHHSSRSSRSKRGRRSRSRERRRPRRRKSKSRDRSRDRHRRRHAKHHRSRSRDHGRGRGRGVRSCSRSKERFRKTIDRKGFQDMGRNQTKDPTKPTFKEQMRQQLLKASKMLTQQANSGQLACDGEQPLESPKEKPSALPLNLRAGYPGIMAGNPSNVTPQMALLQTMAAMHQKAQEMTGIAVPKYYNPAAVNPLKYAEQVQKRKLLWSKNKDKKEVKKEQEMDVMWQATSFNSDEDGKVAAKFRKLMGMKEDEEKEGEHSEAGNDASGSKKAQSEDINRKQQELFQRLDREYEFARMTTHTHRGIGLGFQSQGMPDT